MWRRLNRVDYVAVHYRTTAGNEVATCWEQGRREELLLFVLAPNDCPRKPRRPRHILRASAPPVVRCSPRGACRNGLRHRRPSALAQCNYGPRIGVAGCDAISALLRAGAA